MSATHRGVQHGQGEGDAHQTGREREREADGKGVHLRRDARDEAQHDVDEQQHADHGQGDPQAVAEHHGAEFVQPHAVDGIERTATHREGVEAGNHRLQQHQVAVEHHEQQHGGVAEETAHGAGLGVGGGIEEAGEVQAHLQADDFAGQLDRGEHNAHRQTDRDAHHHLLHHHRERLRVGRARPRAARTSRPAHTRRPARPAPPACAAAPSATRRWARWRTPPGCAGKARTPARPAPSCRFGERGHTSSVFPE